LIFIEASGPAAGLTASCYGHKVRAYEAFLLVVVAGAIQLLMGFLKLGVIGDYIPMRLSKECWRHWRHSYT
jgi:MFS superfamily sulfate permease-like transporter